MKKVLIKVVLATVAATLLTTTAAIAHEKGNHYGQHREAHTHTQPSKDQNLTLPHPAQNGVHGDFHSH